MIFAAGLGTRLGPVTRDTPKALVDVGGHSLLEHVALRLIAAGADRLIINVHHHADLVGQAVERLALPVEVRLSCESVLLDTGGGLLHAAHLFRRDSPLLIHNVDVLSDVDLRGLLAAGQSAGALASLAVHERASTRLLLFDEDGLCGRRDAATGADRLARSTRGPIQALAFAGIHAAAPELFDHITERGKFSIMEVYLRLAREERITGYDVTGVRWHEIGTPERLEQARRAYQAGDW